MKRDIPTSVLLRMIMCEFVCITYMTVLPEQQMQQLQTDIQSNISFSGQTGRNYIQGLFFLGLLFEYGIAFLAIYLTYFS